jgi:hypothetical protein
MIYRDQTPRKSQKSDPVGEVGLVQSAPPAAIDPFHELGTKYIFGFTEGSDIEAEGEKVKIYIWVHRGQRHRGRGGKGDQFETTAAFGMRGGSFSAIEQEIEFENTPTQFLQYELSAHGLLQSVNNVDGLDNFHNFNFSGLSAEFRFLLLGLGPDSPIGLTFVVEPEWARVDDVSGALTRDFSTTFKLVADTELIPNRLYAAANLIYEPGVSREFGTTNWEQSSELGMTAAVALVSCNITGLLTDWVCKPSWATLCTSARHCTFSFPTK